MKILLIRHGKTKGNLEHRYVGSTDEELLAEAESEMRRKRKYVPAEIRGLYASPMKRCVRTAQLLFPGKEAVLDREIRECDFGEFEYRNYQELAGNADYQRFIDTWGKCGFPGGEDREAFQKRCTEAFERILGAWWEKEPDRTIQRPLTGGLPYGKAQSGPPHAGGREGEAAQDAPLVLVVHGGTIMAILDRYSDPHRDYYDWQVANGQGFWCRAVRDAGGLRLTGVSPWPGEE